jgi:adenylate cyclase
MFRDLLAGLIASPDQARQRRRRSADAVVPFTPLTRAGLGVAVGIPTTFGGAMVVAVATWVLPAQLALSVRPIWSLNHLVGAGYVLAAIALSSYFSHRLLSVRRGADPEAVRRVVLTGPARIALVQAALWLPAIPVFSLINIHTPGRAAALAVLIFLAGIASGGVAYRLCERVLRPEVARVLANSPPRWAEAPALRLRAMVTWLLGSGVPLLVVAVVTAAALLDGYPAHRLAIVVLALTAVTMISGLVVTAIAAAATADPIDEVRRGMQGVEGGDYTITVPVFDTSELGLLQAGFNTMVAGLRERERLRDLLDRQVGKDVASLGLQRASAGDAATIGGEPCEVAVMFTDIVGSATLAARRPATEVVTILNAFFAVVVDVVEKYGGWVNKFQGDAALAVFGAPVTLVDAASPALAAARELAKRLPAEVPDASAGIGVSAGPAVAGYVGDPRRYEYTVIGDVVNEAARLSELAKKRGGTIASGSALARANSAEVASWTVTGSRTLRGRERRTDLAQPVAAQRQPRWGSGHRPAGRRG